MIRTELYIYDLWYVANQLDIPMSELYLSNEDRYKIGKKAADYLHQLWS